MLACTKEATIKLPVSEEKLVVTCFLDPDAEYISAVVRLSKPKFGAQPASAVFQDDVRDATVTITDGTNSLVLPFDHVQLFYSAPVLDFPIHPGRSYSMSVSTPDGKMVTASTTVPYDTLQLESAKFHMRSQDSTSFEQDITLSVQDQPDMINYVLFHFANHIETRARSNPNFPDFGGEYSWMNFDTDEKTSHTRFVLSTDNGFYSSDTITHARLDWSVLNCSREFYLYNKSVSEGGFSSPFADPVMIYTNFDKGFGCFGSYRGIHRQFVIR